MPLGFLNQPWEWIAIIVVGLLLFGSRLPSIARSLGKSITEFKKGVKDVKEDLTTTAEAEPKKLEEKREVPVEKVETKEAQKA
ncbi:MAG: twin-arginine translocase TatA/TatE family subunit [Planctomycetes bacterium]|jgi:sec-independent protein translocase protein TatA|nr:twin-arginine translocase TatA/TatE family subunit [Planctomycetota bacterium]MCL4731294.1 twin-arginine translocase TatA/TatE family subunit [Planctomycetota bacterium]